MSVFLRAVGDFLRTWPRLLAADVVYKIVAFVVLTPLVGLALKLFMASKGSSVLADQDILFFVLSPMGLAALVVVGAVSLAILTLEQACLMAIGFGEIRDLHVRTTDALWYGARHARIGADVTDSGFTEDDLDCEQRSHNLTKSESQS